MRIIIALVLLVNSLYSVNFQEQFLRANEFYKEGKVEEALSLYDTIPNKGGMVLYNQGNCAYKLGKKGLALAYWRQAEADWGIWKRGELLHNIALVTKDVPVDSKLPMYFQKMKADVLSFIIAVPLVALQGLFLLLWVLLFLGLRYLYKKKHRSLIVFMFLLIAIFGTLLVLRYSLKLTRKGVVISSSTQVLSGPGETFSSLGNLPEILEVSIKKESNGYYKIKHSGHFGWVKCEDIKEV